MTYGPYLSYYGASIFFPNYAPDNLPEAQLRLKFVTLKTTAVDIAQQGRNAVVRFRIESIHKGDRRWRNLHYSYWQH